MSVPTLQTRANEPTSVTGVQLMQGVGVAQSRGFWAEAWSNVARRPGAVAGMIWVGIVAFFACFAPFIANGHPLWLKEIDASGAVARAYSPLWQHLSATDVLLGIAGIAAPLVILLPVGRLPRSGRLWLLITSGVQAGLIVLFAQAAASYFGQRDLPDWARNIALRAWLPLAVSIAVAVVITAVWCLLPLLQSRKVQVIAALLVGITAAFAAHTGWSKPLAHFNYREREARGDIRAVYTLIPWSPSQRDTQLDLLPPGTTLRQGLQRPDAKFSGEPVFLLGSDSLGQDALSQLLHACRLAISVGLVSTGIAVVIGVTMGALMGYFGGWVDLVLYRVVEVFMAIPVLFLLIVAAAVLPRNTFVMMAIIGCVTWTGAARFTRAEFFKLRNQDFVQSARAVALPLRSVLFKHILPNGVTPVLVDASFAIAAAILAEAVLSFLGLGPADQASWGRLLSEATNQVGAFVWWLAIFPGMAIFLTVLSYNLIGEALRDAIDPKLKKARV